MTKRKKSSSSSKKNPIQRIISAVVGVIVVIVAAIAALLGGGTGSTTPTAQSPFVTQVPASNGSVSTIKVGQGYGAQKGFWQVYFTAPTGSRDASTYTGGIEVPLIAAINSVQKTLDIAAYEWNLPLVTQAVIDAKNRGVTVRMVTDDEGGLGEADSLVGDLIKAGIPVVNDNRQPLMHNKFIIMDSTTVWTGSWNYTVNGTYRNNNNAVVLRSQKVVADYQAEFNEMFVDKKFGPRSPSNTPYPSFTQDGTPIQIYYGSEDDVVPAIINTLTQAKRSIHFLAFSFTLDDVGALLKTKAAGGIDVQGIFETTGSQTQFSELTPLFCAGVPARQDGNPFVLHHKVFIVDGTTVIAGSFNFSASARDDNDENVFIITDGDLAAQYEAEYQRRWAEAKVPTKLTCK
jgi:phosphatidylserine/phosphatidylglycerophosphate/cardiolipin synthase-like enzyme